MSEIVAPPVDVQPAQPMPGSGLVIAALVLAALGGILLCFVETTELSWAVGIITVATTATMVAIDFSRLPSVDSSGTARQNAWQLFVGMCAIWIVGFPVAYFRRQKFGGPKLGVAATVVALFFLIVPTTLALTRPATLPKCDSAVVVKVLDELIRATSAGANAKTIDGLHEVSFDPQAQVRQGECIVHTAAGDKPVEYIVHWQNQDLSSPEVRLAHPDLPTCDGGEVAKLLEQVIRGTPLGATATSIDAAHEVSFDTQANARHGECLVHTPSGDVRVRFVVEWQDEAKGMFQIRLLASE